MATHPHCSLRVLRVSWGRIQVEELLRRGATSVVLSRGMSLALQVTPQTLRLIEKAGVTAHVAQTIEVVDIYHRLTATEPVGGLFHSAC